MPWPWLKQLQLMESSRLRRLQRFLYAILTIQKQTQKSRWFL